MESKSTNISLSPSSETQQPEICKGTTFMTRDIHVNLHLCDLVCYIFPFFATRQQRIVPQAHQATGNL